jgi:hypothetical protein
MLFLANMLSKMKHGTKVGSRIAELVTGKRDVREAAARLPEELGAEG